MSAPQDLGHVHFLGLAGVGVSAVARLMLAAGVPISGTDAKELPVLEEFRAAGVPVRVGYSAQNLASVEAEVGHPVDTLIASSVATAGNPEYDAAARGGLTLLHRSQGLAACMALKRAVAVAGTHGKTTTSSMTAVMLHTAGYQPSFAIGANVTGLGTNAGLGAGEWFVAEADESDGSLLNYSPEVAVVTNVEPDHLDHYGSAEAVEQVFTDFTARITDGGTLVLCAEDAGCLSLRDRAAGPLAARGVDIITYGFGPAADLQVELTAERAGQRISFSYAGLRADAELSVPGEHNGLNAAAAVAVGLSAGLSLQSAVDGVSAYTGSSRRFELRGEVSGIRVYDDYAHHPTEVAAVLSGARSVVGEGRVHAVFQPHLFSRTQDFAAEFGAALQAADTASVLEIYPAREEPIAGVSAALLGHPVRSRQRTVEHIGSTAQPGDIVLTIGAGDITHVAAQIVAELEQLHQ